MKSSLKDPFKASLKKRLRSSRGAVMVEYALLVTFVALPTVVGITAGGVQLVNNYILQKQTILRSSP